MLDFPQENQAPISKLEQDLADLRVENDSLKSARAEYQESYRQNEKELAEKCDMLEECSSNLAELEKLLLAKNVEIAESFGKLAEKDAEFQVLTEKLTTAEASLTQESQQRAALSERLQELNVSSSVSALEEEISTLKDGKIGMK